LCELRWLRWLLMLACVCIMLAEEELMMFQSGRVKWLAFKSACVGIATAYELYRSSSRWHLAIGQLEKTQSRWESSE
jgi:hypothetical protein